MFQVIPAHEKTGAAKVIAKIIPAKNKAKVIKISVPATETDIYYYFHDDFQHLRNLKS